jgi:hypothetical protein
MPEGDNGENGESPDLNEFPDLELPVPEDFMAQEGSVAPLPEFDQEGVLGDLGWEFCLLFNGRPWQTVSFRADSAAEAAAWMDAFTRWVNAQLVRQGYPNGICRWRSGACQ